MRRYGILIVTACVLALAALRSLPSKPVLAGSLLAGNTPTGTTTPTPTPATTRTATQTSTITQTPTKTSTPTITPTVVWYFPFVAWQPTLTPTPTPTVPPTQTPSQTSVASSCAGRFDASITLEESKATYATFIEWVKFLQWVHNNNNSQTCFGILGFDAIRPDTSHMPFNSQWSASLVPDKYLRINANCWGPNGQPCAGDQGSGQQEDHVGDGPYEHTIYEVTLEGVYSVDYYVCYSNYDACQQPGGNWVKLGGIQFTAVNWTPTPGAAQPQATATPYAGPGCYLVTNDPRGIYLNCTTSHMQERRLFRH